MEVKSCRKRRDTKDLRKRRARARGRLSLTTETQSHGENKLSVFVSPWLRLGDRLILKKSQDYSANPDKTCVRQ